MKFGDKRITLHTGAVDNVDKWDEFLCFWNYFLGITPIEQMYFQNIVKSI